MSRSQGKRGNPFIANPAIRIDGVHYEAGNGPSGSSDGGIISKTAATEFHSENSSVANVRREGRKHRQRPRRHPHRVVQSIEPDGRGVLSIASRQIHYLWSISESRILVELSGCQRWTDNSAG